MRDFLRRFGVIIVLVLVVLAGVMFYFSGPRAKPAAPGGAKLFYVDEETGEESVRPITDVPPLEGKSGKPTVVQAVKMSWDGGATQKIVYMVKYTPEGKEALEKMYQTGVQPEINVAANQLVRSVEPGSEWYAAQSADGERVMAVSAPPAGVEGSGPPQVVVGPR